jgi:hypothetical protein
MLDLIGAAAALYGNCSQEVGSEIIYINGVPASAEQMTLLEEKAVLLATEYEQKSINNKALAYLASTDWMVLRQADSGEVMPNNIKDARAAARLEIKP